MNKELDRDLPLKKEIAENIERLRKNKRWTLVDLSEKSGISKSTLSDYKNCKTLISPGNVEKLSEAFGVPKSVIDPSFKRDFITKEESEVYFSSVIDTVELPIVGSISCGNGIFAYEDIEGYKDIPKNWVNGGEHFFLRAKGDSMSNARIEDGDLLLIRKQETFENGEIIAVIIDDEAMLKKVYKTDTSLILQSENPKYPPKLFDCSSEIKIIGKLKMNFIEY